MSEAILSRPISNFFFVSFSSLKRPPLLLETNLEKSWVIRLEFYFEKEDSFSFLKFDRDFFLIFREGSKEGGGDIHGRVNCKLMKTVLTLLTFHLVFHTTGGETLMYI